MVEFKKPSAAEGFTYNPAPQGSPEWIDLRIGRVTASRLADWMAVGKTGKPLASRSAYERELAFERAFRVPFTRFVTEAMKAGLEAESFLKKQVERVLRYEIVPCGAFYSETFLASPDGLVGKDGLVECKWLYDTKFSEVVEKDVPNEHFLQIQGQLWSTGRQWCDYVAGNDNSQAFKIVRVERDEETIDNIKEAVKEITGLPTINDQDIYHFTERIDAPEEVTW